MRALIFPEAEAEDFALARKKSTWAASRDASASYNWPANAAGLIVSAAAAAAEEKKTAATKAGKNFTAVLVLPASLL